LKKNRVIGVAFSLLLTGVVIVAGLYMLGIGPFAQNKASGAPTIEDINERSFDTEEITTNLKSGEFIRAQFRIELDHKDTLTDIDKRGFQVNNVILLTLAEMSAEDLVGEEGLAELQETIQTKLNDHLEQGTVKAVYTTVKVVQ
jgi:flagellar protein FliL